MKQLKVGLDDALRSQLEAAAERSGTSLADEIRRRLEWTLDLEPFVLAPLDEATRELTKTVAVMAADIELETGSTWHRHAGSHKALRHAILANLTRHQPEGPTTFGARPHQSEPSGVPEDIGMWSEYRAWSTRDLTRQARQQYRTLAEQTWRDITKLHTTAGEKDKTKKGKGHDK